MKELEVCCRLSLANANFNDVKAVKKFFCHIFSHLCLFSLVDIQGASGGIVNILGGGSMDFSQ